MRAQTVVWVIQGKGKSNSNTSIAYVLHQSWRYFWLASLISVLGFAMQGLNSALLYPSWCYSAKNDVCVILNETLLMALPFASGESV